MATTSFKKAFLFVLISGTMTVLSAAADKVVLKDGTVEESTRVWETDRYVHFILKGTRSVEIRYIKEIVDHIEDANGVIRTVNAKNSNAAPQPAAVRPTPIPTADPKSSPSAIPMPPMQGTQVDKGKPIQLQRDFIERNRNLNFYDPRRPQRYWADRQSKHTSYAGAIAALAAQYGHSVDWIETHMGQENDLGAIHASLIAAVEAETSSLPDPSNQEQGSTGPLEAKVTTTPVENQPAHVAQEHLSEPTPEYIKPAAGSRSPVAAIPPGIPFYDPRRPQKYWASPKDHCASLEEAIQLLAKIYGAPVAYIESNLGESNDLSQIHANIQKSLGMVPK